MQAFFCFVLTIMLAPKIAAEETLFLDLKSAVHYAIKQNPALASFAKKKEISELALKSAQFSFFPKLHSQASSSLNMNTGLHAQWNNALSIGLEQPILSNTKNGVNVEIARTKDRVAMLEATYERDLLIMKVAKAYFSYAAAVEQLEIKRQKLRVLLKQLDSVNRRFQQGLKTQRDVVRFNAQTQQSRIQEVSAKNEVEKAKDALITIITGSNRQRLLVSFDFAQITPSLALLDAIPLQEPLIENHVLFKKLELEQRIVSLEVDLSRRQLWPELSASANAGGNFKNDLARESNFSPSAMFMMGLALNYELFDFGKRRRDISIAIKNEEIKHNDIEAKLSTETSAIAQMMTSFRLLKQTLRLNQNLLSLEQENFNRIERDYLSGKAQYLDVIAALNNLSDVKSSLVSSLFDLEEQLVMHRFYEGTLYAWIF